MHEDVSEYSNWFKGDKIVFMDPSPNTDTQPYALINKKAFCRWLNENGYALIWIIGGEKQLFTHNIDKFYGRLVYSALYSMDGSGNIIGENWSKNEELKSDNGLC